MKEKTIYLGGLICESLGLRLGPLLGINLWHADEQT